jgi:hypothetical protein
MDQARSLALWDPQASVIKSRITIELLVEELERHHRFSTIAGQTKLSERIGFLRKRGVISEKQEMNLNSIRHHGNAGAHGEITSPQSAALTVSMLENLLRSFLNKG